MIFFSSFYIICLKFHTSTKKKMKNFQRIAIIGQAMRSFFFPVYEAFCNRIKREKKNGRTVKKNNRLKNWSLFDLFFILWQQGWTKRPDFVCTNFSNFFNQGNVWFRILALFVQCVLTVDVNCAVAGWSEPQRNMANNIFLFSFRM